MTYNTTILLIEEHPILAEMIQSFISLHKPFCKIVPIEGYEQALIRLKQQSAQLIITDLEGTNDQDSFAFLAVVNGWNPPIPIIALSDRPQSELSSVASDVTILHKPVDLEVLLELIDAMTQSAQESVLNGVSLENFLQMIEQERKTCVLRIISGYQMGYLYVKEGRLIEARTGSLQHKEAALAILAWPNCTINITESCPVPASMNISIQSLLVEWCIFQDETGRPPAALKAV